MKDMPPEGYTGEWIVRVPGLNHPEQAAQAARRIIKAIDDLGMPGWEVIFDESRWRGGDF